MPKVGSSKESFLCNYDKWCQEEKADNGSFCHYCAEMKKLHNKARSKKMSDEAKSILIEEKNQLKAEGKVPYNHRIKKEGANEGEHVTTSSAESPTNHQPAYARKLPAELLEIFSDFSRRTFEVAGETNNRMLRIFSKYTEFACESSTDGKCTFIDLTKFNLADEFRGILRDSNEFESMFSKVFIHTKLKCK